MNEYEDDFSNQINQEVRLILDINASIDLLVERGKNGININGFFVKRFNDFVRIKLYPLGISEAEFNKFIHSLMINKAYDFRYHAGEKVHVDSVSLNYTISNFFSKTVFIPLLRNDGLGIYFNYTCDWLSPSNDIIFEIENASRGILIKTTNEDYKQCILAENKFVDINIASNDEISIGATGSSYSFLIVLKCIELSMDKTTLSISLIGNTVYVRRKQLSLKSCKFCIFIQPFPQYRLLNGVRTASFKASKFLFAVHAPFSPRIYNWLACAITSKFQIPLSIPSFDIPQPVFPNLVMFDPGGNGWMLPSSKSALRHIQNAEVLVLFGDIADTFFLDCLEVKRYKAIMLVTEKRVILERILNKVVSENVEIINNTPIEFRYRNKLGICLLATDIVFVNSILEDLFIKIVKDTQLQSDDPVGEAWEYHITNRMKSIPYSADLAVGLISVLGNILRGRLPKDDGTSVINYSQYYSDDIWMVPWSDNNNITRAELITELNVRIISEYTAVRAFHELVGKSLPSKTQKEDDEIQFTETVRNFLHLWERWAGTSKDEKSKVRKELLQCIEEYQKDSEDVIRIFARVFYESMHKRSTKHKKNRNEEKLTLINPLVIIYATGDDDTQHDIMLELNSPFWVSYAAQLSSLKTAAIVPTFLPKKIVKEAKSIQSLLRKKLFVFDNSEAECLSIREKRERLGSFIFETIEPAIYHLLEYANADRIVVFSDIMLDFLPIGDSILGLEYPISRYPCEVPAYLTVNYALSGSYNNIPGSRQNKAGILCPVLSEDNVSKWANGLAEHFSTTLKLLGLETVLIDDYDNALQIFEELSNTPILIFLGHGHASEHWAGLNIGAQWLSTNDLSKYDWADSFVFLIGCETAAIDTKNGDLSRFFLSKGARGVVGTTAKIRIDIANVFCTHMIAEMVKGMPADYAFFLARKKAFLFEVLMSKNIEDSQAIVDRLFNSDKSILPIRDLLSMFSITLNEAMNLTPYSMTLTLLGGGNQTLV